MDYGVTLNQLDSLAEQYKFMGGVKARMAISGTTSLPMFNYAVPTYQGNVNFGWTPYFGTSSTTNSGNKTWEQYCAGRNSANKLTPEQQQEKEKKQALSQGKQEILKQVDETIKQNEINQQKINQTKNDDGTYSDMAHIYKQDEKTGKVQALTTKDTSKGKKALRFIVNTATAGWNMAKGMLGIEKDGSFNIGKLGLSAACIVGGKALLAFPPYGTAIAVGLLAAGAIIGTVGAVKSGIEISEHSEKSDKAAEIINNADDLLSKAKNDKEREQIQAKIDKAQVDYVKEEKAIDEAQQSVATNAIVAATSIWGGWKMGNTFRTTATTASQASSATQRSSFLGKIWEGISNFGRDIFINSAKSAKHSYVAQKAALDAGTSRWQLWKNNFFGGLVSEFSMKEQYKREFANMQNELNAKIAEIDTKLSNPALTDSERLNLLHEKTILNNNIADLQTVNSSSSSKSVIEGLQKDNSATRLNKSIGDGSFATRNAAGEYEIKIGSNSFKLSAEDYTQYVQRIQASQEQQASQLKSLVKSHNKMMYRMASPYSRGKWKLSQDESDRLNNYLQGTNLKWYKTKKVLNPNNWLKTKQQMAISKTGTGMKESLKSFGTLTFINPESNILKGYTGYINPIYTSPLHISGQEYTPDQTRKMEKALEQNTKTLKEIREKLSKATTEEDITNAAQLASAYQMLVQSDNTKGYTILQVEEYAAKMVIEAQKQAQAEAEQQAAAQAAQGQQSGADGTAS